MKWFRVSIYFIIIPLLLAFSIHKFYVSTIRVEYQAQSESVQITMRIFTDDLQKVINETYNNNFQLDVHNESNETDSLINTYLLDNFFIKINGRQKKFNYLGKEYDADITFLYSEIENVDAIKSIEIKDTMLMEFFSDQKNIIKLYINDIRKTFFLTSKKDKDLLKLE